MRGERWTMARSGVSFDAGAVRVRCERGAPEPELRRLMKLASAAPELLDVLETLAQFAMRAVNDEPNRMAAIRNLEREASSAAALVIALRSLEGSSDAR